MGSETNITMRSTAWALVLTAAMAASPTQARAQTFGWQIAASVLLDPDHSGGTETGPGLTAVALLRPDERLSYALTASVARTDFTVESDDLHRNHGAIALGVRYATTGTGPRIGLNTALGILTWDDVSETDPTFRSSADAAALLILGLEGTLPITRSLRASLALRDLATGWWYALFDPEEGDVRHRMTVSLGVEFRP